MVIPTAAPTCGPKVMALNAPARAPTSASPTMAPKPTAARSDPDRGGEPDQDPDQRAHEQPDHQRSDARLDVQARGFPGRRIGLVRPFEAEGHADHDGDHDADDERAGEPAARDADGAQRGRHGDGQEREDPVEDAPAERPEQPLPEEQGDSDDPEEPGQDDHRDRTAGERGDAPDLSGDRRQLRLRQLDVCLDQRHRGVARREQLGAQTARRPARVTRSGGRSVSIGSSRVMLRLADGRRDRALGRTPMIPAPPAASPARPLRSGHARCPIRRHLLTAELLSIGSELTVGDTRDTNAGELARSLTALGVRVTRLTALPDDLRRGHRCVPVGPGAGRSRGLDRRSRSHARRPDPRGDRRGLRGDADRRPRSSRRGSASCGADATCPVPRAQPEAGLADPVGGRASPTRTARPRAGS